MREDSQAFKDFRDAVRGWAFATKRTLGARVDAGRKALGHITDRRERQRALDTLETMELAYARAINKGNNNG